jgi:hypothetical protein
MSLRRLVLLACAATWALGAFAQAPAAAPSHASRMPRNWREHAENFDRLPIPFIGFRARSTATRRGDTTSEPRRSRGRRCALGAVCLACGRRDGGNQAAYFFLGQP